MSNVTFETVAIAAQALIERGERASVRKVIAELGGGSPNWVLGFLNEWKSGRPVISVDDLKVSEGLLSAIKREISDAAKTAGEAAEAKAAEGEENLNLIRDELNQAEHKIEAFQAAIADANAEIEALKTELTTNLASSKSTEERFAATISDLQKTADAQRIQIDNMLRDAGKHENQAIINDAKIWANEAVIRGLKEDIQATKQVTEQALKDVAQAQKEAARHEMLAAINAERLSAATSEINSIKTVNAEKLASVQREAESIKASHAEMVAALRAQIASLEARADRAEVESVSCRVELKKLTDAQFREALEAKGQQRLTE